MLRCPTALYCCMQCHSTLLFWVHPAEQHVANIAVLSLLHMPQSLKSA